MAQIRCEFCSAIGTTGKNGYAKCSNCGNQKSRDNQPNRPKVDQKGLVPDGARTDDKYGLRTAAFGGFGCITITVGAAICVVGVITLMPIIKGCNEVMPRHPVGDWMENQRHEREQREKQEGD